MNFRLLSLAVAVLFISACGVDTAELGGDEFAQETLSADELALVNNGRFETFQGKDGQYYFHLLAGNGEKVLQSEGYATFAASQNGVTSVQNNGTTEQRYLLREARDGSWYFVLTATNGQIIGVSEMYATKSNATRAIASVIAVVQNTVAQGPAAQGAIRFEVFKGLDAKYYFHLRAQNGQIVLQSQGYSTKTSAQSATASVKNNGTVASMYSVLEAKDGKYYFVLKATNGRVIGLSELYASRYNAERGVQTVIDLLNTMR